MITGNPLDLHFPDVFFEMAGLVPDGRMLLKLEGFNITGSIKLKSALFMVEHLERAGLLEPGRSTLVESSSGNLGVAVALICRMRGYGFVCVTDPNISAVNLRAIRAYGGRIDRVETKDEQGGYLRTRLDRVARLLAEDPDRVWLNQYANPANARAHAQWTALQILQSVPDVTHLYVGTGTTGTMMGLAESFSRLSPKTELVAVEPEGSVTFGAPRPGRRRLPGLGTSSRPAIADAGRVHRIVHVAERDAVRRCHRTLESHGLLVGSSTGYVLEAVAADADGFAPDSVVVGVSPDFGDKYLDTLYDTEWLDANFEDAEEAFPGVGEDVGPGAPLCGPLSEILNHRQGDGEGPAPAPFSPLHLPTH
ncbi:pyridoxal-phosphate dependent enzyme [Streptomyces sp. NRRL S-237]|uniref:pyridoxal-phosphate dependent enzyme n=1 Tax=Streptomyces sp. NRRL S-237 TaxID=1463895 RepID=UPI000689571C|nr:pyridoxal-phosphate dependent enzyme [Streptomyces sp. NRRL S-237]